jgi:hypothetical protein
MNATGSGGLRIGGSAAVTVFRSSLNRNNQLKTLADQASKILGAVLGPSRGGISEEWDLAEDADGRPRVTVKLSDFTGEVAASFDPTELDHEEHMRLRLSLLSADLLKARSNRQIDALTASQSKGS